MTARGLRMTTTKAVRMPLRRQGADRYGSAFQ
jgi:hypothetical protein